MQNSLGPNKYDPNDNPYQYDNQYQNYNYNYPNNNNKSHKGLIIALIVSNIIVIGLCVTMCIIMFTNNKNEKSSVSERNRDSISDSEDKTEQATEKDTSDYGRGTKNLIKVGIINNDPNESGYRAANDKDLKATFCEANGYEASFAYSMKNDEQIEFAKKFIDEKVDYLLISAADIYGWDSVLQDARDAGIRVMLFDRTIDVDESLYYTMVISDMDKEGEQAVNWLKDQNLSEYKIVHLQGVMGSQAQQGRGNALDTAAEEYGWTLVTQQTAEWNAEKAEQIVQSVIDSGESFNVIYADNDGMAKGAVAALDKAGISHGVGGDVIIIAFDCNTWALEELLQGNWNYDGQCSPFQAAYLDEAIRNMEAGERLPKITLIDEIGFEATTITREDVDKYGI